MTELIMEKVFLCENINELDGVAEKILKDCGDNRVIALYGEMGAGKTTLIKSICKKLGVSDTVTSPTFAIVNEYILNAQPVYHFDFYRINAVGEAFDLGYENFFYSKNYCFIEWPEKIKKILPFPRAEIYISVQNGKRQLKLIV